MKHQLKQALELIGELHTELVARGGYLTEQQAKTVLELGEEVKAQAFTNVVRIYGPITLLKGDSVVIGLKLPFENQEQKPMVIPDGYYRVTISKVPE